MSWITKSSLSWVQLFCVRILKCGVVPKHVAFIMDGNRRYAKKNNVNKTAGHSKGFDKLAETLQWCLEFGISEVTVYAFSIENFKRSEEEVDSLLELARQKFLKLLDEREKLMEQGVRIRVIGNRSLIPDDIVKSISEAELLTKDNNKCYLNIAFSYTARDEITHAVQTVVEGVEKGLITEEDLSSELLSRCLYTQDSPVPDLLIRTSGETRLSDFLLWQAAHSYLYFTNVLWPDFTAWDLMGAIFHYQRAQASLTQSSHPLELHSNKGISKKAENFLMSVDEKYWSTVRESVLL